MKIRSIIIDDEDRSRETVFEMLKLYCSNVEVIAQAEDVASGIDAIKNNKPDLVFLDIRMPDGTGFDLVRQIKPVDFKIIFITAYEEYAIKAFKFSAIDYLLKPIDPEELIQAVEKMSNAVTAENMNSKINDFFTYLDHVGKNTNDKKIILKTFENIYVVDINNIVSIESDMNYSRFYLIDGEKIIVSRSIKEYEEMLQGYNFYRIHQSYIVNLNYIKVYNREENHCIMSDGSKIPVSYRKKDELFTLFRSL